MTKFITLPAAKIMDADGLHLAVLDEVTLRQGIALFDQARENTLKDFEIHFLKKEQEKLHAQINELRDAEYRAAAVRDGCGQ